MESVVGLPQIQRRLPALLHPQGRRPPGGVDTNVVTKTDGPKRFSKIGAQEIAPLIVSLAQKIRQNRLILADFFIVYRRAAFEGHVAVNCTLF